MRLEINANTCRYLQIDIDKIGEDTPIDVYLGSSSNRKINISDIKGIELYATKCELTGEPCAWHDNHQKAMDFGYMIECPAFVLKEENYLLEGTLSRHIFRATKAKRVQV